MNTFNKKNILLLSISTFMMTGCFSTRTLIVTSERTFLPASALMKTTSTWKKSRAVSIKNPKKDDCIDCYATDIIPSKAPVVTRTFAKLNTKAVNNYSLPPISTQANRVKRYGSYEYIEKVEDLPVVNTYTLEELSPINSAYGSYSTYANSNNIAIQVGAFRQYSGAQRYKRRYSALSNKYNVNIKTSIKYNQPLHRVRIEGFESENEAKRFMNTYGISNAFFVRK